MRGESGIIVYFCWVERKYIFFCGEIYSLCRFFCFVLLSKSMNSKSTGISDSLVTEYSFRKESLLLHQFMLFSISLKVRVKSHMTVVKQTASLGALLVVTCKCVQYYELFYGVQHSTQNNHHHHPKNVRSYKKQNLSQPNWYPQISWTGGNTWGELTQSLELSAFPKSRLVVRVPSGGTSAIKPPLNQICG